MLVGQYLHTIDEKGRLAIPAKFRKELGEGAVMTRGFDGCLVVYPRGEWESVAAKIGGYPESKARARAFARLFFGGAAEVSFDGQGRALVPEYLRVHAELISEVVIVGLMNRFEIWDKSRFETYRKRIDKEERSIERALEELGF